MNLTREELQLPHGRASYNLPANSSPHSPALYLAPLLYPSFYQHSTISPALPHYPVRIQSAQDTSPGSTSMRKQWGYRPGHVWIVVRWSWIRSDCFNCFFSPFTFANILLFPFTLYFCLITIHRNIDWKNYSYHTYLPYNMPPALA